jgi:membrane-associated phospholipid phosphatase
MHSGRATAGDPVDARPRVDYGYHSANFLSYFLNPLVLPPIGFALILWHFGAPPVEIVLIAGVALVFFCLIPLAYVVRMIRRGEARTLEVREQDSRLKPFLVGIASYAVGIAVMATVGTTAVPLLVALALLYPINTALIVLINLRWKISVHMTSLAGFVSILLFVAMTIWRALPPETELVLTVVTVAPLLVLLPLLMWARIRVKAHTLGQVVAGTVFGLVVPAVELFVIVRALGLVEG